MDTLAEKTHWYDVEYTAERMRIKELEFELLDVICERDELIDALAKCEAEVMED